MPIPQRARSTRRKQPTAVDGGNAAIIEDPSNTGDPLSLQVPPPNVKSRLTTAQSPSRLPIPGASIAKQKENVSPTRLLFQSPVKSQPLEHGKFQQGGRNDAVPIDTVTIIKSPLKPPIKFPSKSLIQSPIKSPIHSPAKIPPRQSVGKATKDAPDTKSLERAPSQRSTRMILRSATSTDLAKPKVEAPKSNGLTRNRSTAKRSNIDTGNQTSPSPTNSHVSQASKPESTTSTDEKTGTRKSVPRKSLAKSQTSVAGSSPAKPNRRITYGNGSIKQDRTERAAKSLVDSRRKARGSIAPSPSKGQLASKALPHRPAQDINQLLKLDEKQDRGKVLLDTWTSISRAYLEQSVDHLPEPSSYSLIKDFLSQRLTILDAIKRWGNELRDRTSLSHNHSRSMDVVTEIHELAQERKQYGFVINQFNLWATNVAECVKGNTNAQDDILERLDQGWLEATAAASEQVALMMRTLDELKKAEKDVTWNSVLHWLQAQMQHFSDEISVMVTIEQDVTNAEQLRIRIEIETELAESSIKNIEERPRRGIWKVV